jgi:LPS O-antigen subunit length determinant protein (WzzB/FepE family)
MENNNYLNLPVDEDQIDIRKLILVLWNKKFFITSMTFLAAFISILYALSLPNIYTSKALLSPSNNQETLSSSLGNLSGLAGIAGVSLPGDSGNPTIEAIERIKSYDFFVNYFLPNIELKNLLAISNWSQPQNVISYNKKVYDSKKNEWVKTKATKGPIPSNQQAFKKYKQILSVKEIKKTGFVSISIEHESPNIAKEWVELIVKYINESMREIDRQEATDLINFLNETYSKSSVNNVKESITNLIQDQMQKLMLTAATDGYVFKIIESPYAPELKTSPSRAFICIFGTILGFILGCAFVIFNSYLKKDKQ